MGLNTKAPKSDQNFDIESSPIAPFCSTHSGVANLTNR